MTITDIIVKILLFFSIFYGAIAISSIISKRIRKAQTKKDNKT